LNAKNEGVNKIRQESLLLLTDARDAVAQRMLDILYHIMW